MVSKLTKIGVSFFAVIISGCMTPEVIVQSEANKQLGLPYLAPTPEMRRAAIDIVDRLNYSHYVEKKIDDGLSAQVFESYLETLDKNKMYFLASDIAELEQFKNQLDDTLKIGQLAPGFEIYNRFQRRSVERINFVLNELQNWSSYEFKNSDIYDDVRLEASWETTEESLNTIWRQKIEAALLSLKLSGKSLEESKEILTKRYKNNLSRVYEARSMDAFQTYMNALATSYDPHTFYYIPLTSKNVDTTLNLSHDGIGAVLQTEEEYTKVVRLVPSGPADGKLFPGDKIIAVGQDQNNLVDVTGWRIDEVVQLIRGPKNSYVHLELIRHGSSTDETHKISIERQSVKLIEQKARKRIVELDGHNIGIINIPSFYIDFRAMQRKDRNYVSTTRDVKKLLTELERSKVDGIVLDLRANSGGALTEVNSLTGLFIESGPVVQIRDDRGRVEVYRDTDSKSYYSGPLIVLVDRLSASATEIFAGALQDYQRALIVGDTTFGMGSVSALRALSFGQLKITQAKFYRITGVSTHLHGITPDIKLPSIYDHYAVGESSLKNTLPEDRMNPQNYTAYPSLSRYIPELRKISQKRIDTDPDMIHLEENKSLSVELMNRKTALNEAERRNQQLEIESRRIDMENKRRAAKGMKLVESVSQIEVNDVSRASMDIENDGLLRQSAHVLVDFIKLQSKHQ